MASTPLLLLIGLRCSGKTTLGAAIAARLGVTFNDLDPQTLRRLGASNVHQAWHDHGEAGWRRAEGEALDALLQGDTAGVISLGGGTPTAPGVTARIRLEQAAGRVRVALLDPGEEESLERLRAGRGDRPMLGNDDASEVAAHRAERLPLYRSLADAVIDTRMSKERCLDRLTELVTPDRRPSASKTASGSPRVRSRRAP